MTRLETFTDEYDHCGECLNVEQMENGNWKCLLKKKRVSELWGNIPKWCPLPEKENNEKKN